MGYISENLLEDDEEITFITYHSWWKVRLKLLPIYVLILGLGASAIFLPIFNFTTLVSALIGIGTVLVLAIITYIAMQIHETAEFVVTQERVIAKDGIFQNDIYEITKDTIESINIDQNFMGKILSVGDIEINGTGDEDKKITNLAHPIQFKKAIW